MNLNDLQDNVKVVFLPPRTMSIIQPLDQDIMCYFKAIYLEKTFAELHKACARDYDVGIKNYWKTFSILDCVRFIGRSWEATTEAVLNRGWKKPWPDVVTDFVGFTRVYVVN